MTEKRESPFRKGDTVILTGVNMHGSSEAQVTRVGRTNAYIMLHGREKAFDAFDGSEKGVYSHYIIETPERHAERQRRGAARESLIKHGVSVNSFRTKISTTKLERIAAILEEDD